MNIDLTTIITHILTLITGVIGGYNFKSIIINKSTKSSTKGKNSPIFSNKGDVNGRFGDD